MSSIIEGIREFLLTCPLLKDGIMHVNYLENEPMQFTIDEIPTTPILKCYADGSTVRQTHFVIASSAFYSRDALENLKACGFYEQLADWLEKNNNAGILPELPAGCSPISIKTTTNGYCIETDIRQNVQRYQVQCRLIYLKEF